MLVEQHHQGDPQPPHQPPCQPPCHPFQLDPCHPFQLDPCHPFQLEPCHPPFQPPPCQPPPCHQLLLPCQPPPLHPAASAGGPAKWKAPAIATIAASLTILRSNLEPMRLIADTLTRPGAEAAGAARSAPHSPAPGCPWHTCIANRPDRSAAAGCTAARPEAPRSPACRRARRWPRRS